MIAHLKIQCHYPEMPQPKRAYSTDAGIDLTAQAIVKRQGMVFFFDTGVSVQISDGYYVETVPRSSLSKTNFIMANSVGIIDPEYRGHILAALRYTGNGNAEEEAKPLLNQRIVQLIVRRFEPCTIEIVSNLNDTERGANGFGSTG